MSCTLTCTYHTMLFFSRCFVLSSVVALTVTASMLNDGCRIGEKIDNTTSNVITASPANQIYLNLENPATCTGLIYSITFCALITENGTTFNTGNFSIWKPGETRNSYKKIISSETQIKNLNLTCNLQDENEAKSLICSNRCLDNPIKIEPGYVLGLEVLSYAADNYALIAKKTDQSIGLCVSNETTEGLDGSVEFKCDNNSEYINRTLLLETDVYPIYCDTLTLPVNGAINSTNSSYTTSVSFDCAEYYTINSSLVLICLENGWNNVAMGEIWNGELPICTLSNCSNPGIPVNGRSIGDERLSFANGSTVSFECNTGYHLYGATDTQCLEGTWSSTIPNCTLITCPSPSSPKNGRFYPDDSNSFPFNTTVEFTCRHRYSLTNEYPLICLANGTWNASVPKCAAVPTSSINNSTNSESDTLGNNFKFLILGMVLTLFLFLLCIICLLTIMLIRNQPKSNSATATSDSLKEQLLKDVDGAHYDSGTLLYDISPYAVVNMPIELCVSTQHGMTYFKRQQTQPASYSSSHNTPVGSIHSRSPPGVLTPKYITPAFSPIPIPFRASLNPMEELEQSLKNEHPYCSPADAEEEIYFQLNTMKVKTIPSTQIRMLDELGGGEFATVHKGVLSTDDGDKTDVAVKTPKSMPSLDQEDKLRFLKEAAIMGQFHHLNVLKLFGVIVDEPEKIMIVVEFMKNGDLLNYLQVLKTKDNRDKLPFLLLNYCRQICLGMTYLSGKGFIHRDLAARNILVSDDGICKISDFGMSHDMEEESYYLVHDGGLIPVKWTAPEAIRDRKYSTASDVWSYGCVLYEIWSLGCKPFKGASTTNAIKILKTGQRLTPPPGCPREIYHIMIKTWHPLPNNRPHFNDIMLSMLRSDKDILILPEETTSSHPTAGELGADLQAGVHMYKDLQNTYLK